jgi:hypothetical protein
MKDRSLRRTRYGNIVPDGEGLKFGNVAALPTANQGLEGEVRRLNGKLYTCVKTGGSTWTWCINPNLADPNADRIIFWDDSAGDWAFLAAGDGLSISDTTLSATATAPILSSALTIASDAVTLPEIASSVAIVHLTVDTEAAAGSDTLATINVTGTVAEGTMLIIRSAASTRDVTVAGTGNLDLATSGNFNLTHRTDRIVFAWASVADGWVELSRSDNIS